MPGLTQLSPEHLAEWQKDPVTQFLHRKMADSLEAQVSACKADYFQGKPWDEASRLALIRTREVVEDIFTASADDFNMDVTDGKHERD